MAKLERKLLPSREARLGRLSMRGHFCFQETTSFPHSLAQLLRRHTAQPTAICPQQSSATTLLTRLVEVQADPM
jgi:hypothetical protein